MPGKNGNSELDDELLDDELDTEIDLDAEEETGGAEEDRGDVVEPKEDEEPAVKAGKGGDEEEELDSEALEEIAGEEDENGNVRVPIGRFNEINQRMKEAEKKLADLEEKSPAAPKAEEEQEKAYDFDDAEKRYLELVQDGDEESALELRREIRAAEKALYEKSATEAARKTLAEDKTATAEKTARQLLVEESNKVVSDYPFLDGEKGDKDAIDAVLSIRDRLIREQQMPWHQALRTAADRVAKMIGKKPGKDEAGEEKDEQGKETGAERKARLLRENAANNRQQPPKGKELGLGERAGELALDPNELTDEEFDALPAKEKARLRGDNV